MNETPIHELEREHRDARAEEAIACASLTEVLDNGQWARAHELVDEVRAAREHLEDIHASLEAALTVVGERE
jgi:hypothetical protein